MMQSLPPTRLDMPYHGLLSLKDAQSGEAVTEDSLQTTHTRKLHLFVVDKSLRDYQHIHPTPTTEAGVYAFEFTPHSNQPYTLWGEFTRVGKDAAERITLDLPHTPCVTMLPALIPSKTAQVGAIKAEWVESPDTPLQQGKVTEVQVRLRDAVGNPITQLDDVMGAKGHMAGFSADGQHFIHAHPMETEDVSLLRFHIQPDHAGMTRFFLQIQQDGQEIYLPFNRMVKEKEKSPVHYSASLSRPEVVCRYTARDSRS
jgi:hypothetical protein